MIRTTKRQRSRYSGIRYAAVSFRGAPTPWLYSSQGPNCEGVVSDYRVNYRQWVGVSDMGLTVVCHTLQYEYVYIMTTDLFNIVL